VASTFEKDNHTTRYEGTVVSFDFSTLNYGISWDDSDYSVDSSNGTIPLINNWFVKTGQDAKHLFGHSFELCDHPLPTAELTPMETGSQGRGKSQSSSRQKPSSDLSFLFLKEQMKDIIIIINKAKSDSQKDKYSQKCVCKGNLSKAVQTLYKESFAISLRLMTGLGLASTRLFTVPKMATLSG